MNTTSLVSTFLSILVVVASSTVLQTAITAFMNRKKLDVDMSKTKVDGAAIISATAIDQVEAMSRQLERARVALDAWREWGRTVVKQARAKGIDFDDPPDDWF